MTATGPAALVWGAALCAGAAAMLALRLPAATTADEAGVIAASPTNAELDQGWLQRWRWLLALSGGIGALTFLGGFAGAVAAPIAAVATWVAVGRVEPGEIRRARERAARELPHVVRLLGVALTSGTPPADALEIVADALPGPAGDRLRPVVLRLRLGADPAAGWAALGADPALAPLGRTLARAEEGGVSVATSVARLADDLAAQTRAEVERRARAVGVKAAAPLGLCLLPAFLLIGIVPLVGGLLTSLPW